MGTLTTLALALASAAGGGASDFAGSAVCASCHAEIAERQTASRHAWALRPAAEHPLAARFTTQGAVEIAAGFAFRFYRTAAGLRVRGVDHAGTLDHAVEWAFGAGGQGVTFVSQLDREQYLEHSLSFFPEASRFARTPGHEHKPRSLEQAAGLVYDGGRSGSGVGRCFECHSTGPVEKDEAGGFHVGEMGVRCEACHGPSAAHAAAPDRSRPRQLGGMEPRQQLELCGACHRQPIPSAGVDWSDPWNVRHAPVYLSRSDCFREGGVSCTSCHDPHGPLLAPARAPYNDRCRGCHASPHDQSPARTDCVECHMPPVRPHEQLTFTNHWIGVYDPRDPLRPRR